MLDGNELKLATIVVTATCIYVYVESHPTKELHTGMYGNLCAHISQFGLCNYNLLWSNMTALPAKAACTLLASGASPPSRTASAIFLYVSDDAFWPRDCPPALPFLLTINA